MLVRYKQDERGRNVPFADIYSPKEHHIKNSMIDKDAIWAIRKLQKSGHEAYLVGGAVRDLMLGIAPKDFDITTSASPRQIQRMFHNARIIGRRFKLVHLLFGPKIIEVSTFRSAKDAADGSNNVFGSVDQDAKRRDFSINSLYYNPINGQLFDFNKAIGDFKKRKITSIIPINKTFIEDPVRMIRAIKYSITTGFTLRRNIRRGIRRYATELSHVSTSRLSEEVHKILGCGHSSEIFDELNRNNLLVYMLPAYCVFLNNSEVVDSLKVLDEKALAARRAREEVRVSDQIYYLVNPLIVIPEEGVSADDRFRDVYGQIKSLTAPMTPPNFEIERAAATILKEAGFKLPKRAKRSRTGAPAKRRRRPRRRGDQRRRPGSQNRRKGNSPRSSHSPAPKSSAEAHDL